MHLLKLRAGALIMNENSLLEDIIFVARKISQTIDFNGKILIVCSNALCNKRKTAGIYLHSNIFNYAGLSALSLCPWINAISTEID